ncbi:hypothetical protein [Kordia periserrulae]|uniref:hypothetical protein n=1 Tax=Kordia periserrulae TaxID=701523 RepID=UPI0011B1E56F|nr:hypothetical protein [Kordia periserrulae]
MLASNLTYTDDFTNTTSTIIRTESSGEISFESPRIMDDESGSFGASFSDTKEDTLDSVLGYFIFIFFSVLVIILIDNRNLEKRYKKLLTEFKSKDSTI